MFFNIPEGHRAEHNLKSRTKKRLKLEKLGKEADGAETTTERNNDTGKNNDDDSLMVCYLFIFSMTPRAQKLKF